MEYIIVGYGNIGHKRQAALGNKCVATVDPNPKTKADYLNHKLVPFEVFDTAVLTVPQQPKLELLEYFLTKGKHVLVEKPLIITRQQGQKLTKIAKKKGVIWHTSYNHRFEPNIIKIKKLLGKGCVGNLYHARFIYSFGNIKERMGTWRETKYGVLEEIAPHLIDFVINFFGYNGQNFKPLIKRKIESKIFDHWMFSTTDQKIIFETSAVTWKNVFLIEIFGEKGSLHMNGLRKWGRSQLIIRERIFPAGAPKERKTYNKGPDLTWKKDFDYFEKMAKLKQTSLENDLNISQALAKIQGIKR